MTQLSLHGLTTLSRHKNAKLTNLHSKTSEAGFVVALAGHYFLMKIFSGIESHGRLNLGALAHSTSRPQILNGLIIGKMPSFSQKWQPMVGLQYKEKRL